METICWRVQMLLEYKTLPESQKMLQRYCENKIPAVPLPLKINNTNTQWEELTVEIASIWETPAANMSAALQGATALSDIYQSATTTPQIHTRETNPAAAADIRAI